jgi:hypothetical protein
MSVWWETNFAHYAFGDRRLDKRALAIGKALSEGFGKAFSEIFGSGKELKRAYEFSAISKLALLK